MRNKHSLLVAALALTGAVAAARHHEATASSSYQGDQPKAPKPTFTERRKAEKRKKRR